MSEAKRIHRDRDHIAAETAGGTTNTTACATCRSKYGHCYYREQRGTHQSENCPAAGKSVRRELVHEQAGELFGKLVPHGLGTGADYFRGAMALALDRVDDAER